MTEYNFFYNTWVTIQFIAELLCEISRNLFRFLPGVGPIVYHNDKLLNGQLVIITGANSGIGKETVLQLAKRKAKVSHHMLRIRSV